MSPSLRDYYQILGVDPNAGQASIKDAYRALVKKYHPDINRDPAAPTFMKYLNEARDILLNASRRQEYDKLRAAHFGFEIAPEASIDAIVLYHGAGVIYSIGITFEITFSVKYFRNKTGSILLVITDEHEQFVRQATKPSRYASVASTQPEYIYNSSAFTPTDNDCSFVSQIHIPYASFPPIKAKYKSCVAVMKEDSTLISNKFSEMFLLDRSEVSLYRSSQDTFEDLYTF